MSTSKVAQRLSFVFLAGLGGTLPSLSRIGAQLVSQPELPPPHVINISVGLFIYFIVGAVVGLALIKDGALREAIPIGIAAPALISNTLAGYSVTTSAHQPPPRDTPRIESSWNGSDESHGFVSVNKVMCLSCEGRVQTAAEMAPQATSILVVFTADDPPGLTYNSRHLEVYFGDGRAWVAHETILTGDRAYWEVPRAVNQVSVVAANGISSQKNFPPNAKEVLIFAVNAVLRTRASGEGDFLWALGFQRRYEISSIEIRVTPHGPLTPGPADGQD